MLDYLYNTHAQLIKSSAKVIERQLVNQIDWDCPLICIKGARGVGKSIFLFDYIKNRYGNDKSALYLNLNDFYFTRRNLFSFADEFSKKGGRILFLDQINKYPDWSEELKKCYDEIPGLKIVFTSSPVLRVASENPDLQGIAQVYHLPGLSFREFLNFKTGENLPVYTLSEILENHVDIAQSIVAKLKPLAYFEDYLKYGYYPYFKDSLPFYNNKLLKNINLTLEIDIPYINQIELRYLSKLRKLLYIISSETPFSPNVSRLAGEIETSRATVMNYLKYLRNARLIHLLYNNGDEDEAKKPVKVYMNNTNLLYAVSPENAESRNLRHTFFYNQLSEKYDVKSSADADFLIDGEYDFFVGGRKTKAPQGKFAAADVIETGDKNTVPLWLFGFLY